MQYAAVKEDIPNKAVQPQARPSALSLVELTTANALKTAQKIPYMSSPSYNSSFTLLRLAEQFLSQFAIEGPANSSSE